MSPADDVAAGTSDPAQAALLLEKERTLAELVAHHRLEVERLEAELTRERREKNLQQQSLTALANNLYEATLVVDRERNLIMQNPAVERCTGLTAEQLLSGYGTLYTTSLPRQPVVARDDLPLARALRGEEVRDVFLAFHTEDRDITLQCNASPVRDADGFICGAVLSFHDVSRGARAERRSQLLNGLTDILSGGRLEAGHFDSMAALVGEVMGAWSVLALTHGADDELEIVATYHPDPESAAELSALAGDISLAPGIDPGMGRVAATGKPMIFTRMPSLYAVPNLDVRLPELFAHMGSESMLIVPLKARGSTLGVLMLVSLPHHLRFTPEDLEYSFQLADRIAATLDSVYLLTDLRRKEWRMRMVAQLSRQFAMTLELQSVLRTVVVQVAEALGDWCTIGLLDEDGRNIRPAAVHHRLPTQQATLQRLVESYPIEAGEGIQGRVIATQQAIWLDNLTAQDLRGGRLPEVADLVDRLRPSSYICAPLAVRGKPLGYIDVACTATSDRRLTTAERDLVQELADRAAWAIQNAQLYAELQDVIRAKDDWLSVASHELKTPLTPLQVLLQLMVRRVRKNEPIGLDQLERCLGQVSRLIRLINDLLDVSKVELGQLELTQERIELRSLVQEVVNGFKDSSELHRVTFHADSVDPVVLGDRARIEQVVVNLVHNGIKYSPEGGEVVVDMRLEPLNGREGVLLGVEDHGIGIPQRDQARLFQRYFRASNVPERNFGGLGLGLWISAEIVRRHEGALWAESEAGHGSRFYFWLPVAREAAVTNVASKPVILFVDDDEAILEAGGDCLRDEGYEVVVARNGQVAMTLLLERRPDIVLLDLMMPLMDGWEFMRRIRALPEGLQIPVIIVSATHDLPSRAQEIGASDFVSKPFNLDELLKKIARLVGGKKEQA